MVYNVYKTTVEPKKKPLWQNMRPSAAQSVRENRASLRRTGTGKVIDKEGNRMVNRTSDQKRTREQIMQDINRKLPLLPRDQQNMVAAFAQGIRAGLACRAPDATVSAGQHAPAGKP